MRLLFDTNVCIDVLRGRPEVVARLREHSPGDLFLSSVTVFELVKGAGRAPFNSRNDEAGKVRSFIGRFRVAAFDTECGTRAGEIHAKLLNDGNPVGILDVFIAAVALVRGVPVVTSNVRGFSRIEGLEVIDWRVDAGGSRKT